MATSGKTPVSILQELMAGKKHPLPTYFEEDACGQFKCTVSAGSVVAIGFGTTKKAAKQESAKNALEKIKAASQIVILQEAQNSQKNYVGELNEYSQKKCIAQPEYSPVQILAGIDEYTCTCTFWGRKTHGIGKSKKDAKQNAAKEMIKHIYTAEAASASMNSEGVKELRSVFDNLTLYSLNLQSPKPSTSSAVTDIRIVEEDSVEMLRVRLRAQGIDYVINEMSRDPYVLCLKIKDTDYVFVENGDTRDETMRKLLRKVLLVKESGCSLNPDLIRF